MLGFVGGVWGRGVFRKKCLKEGCLEKGCIERVFFCVCGKLFVCSWKSVFLFVCL